jgi:hypothetical protein
LRANGEGGGLRDFDRLASSCKNGIGENSGVAGAIRGVDEGNMLTFAMVPGGGRGGKEVYVEVMSMDFSTARRYLPTDLYCCMGLMQSSQTRWIVNGGLLRITEID